MIEFIDTDNYVFHPEMRAEHAHITMLDFHIHAYLVGTKYGVPKLRELAIQQYINFGNMIMSMDFLPMPDSTSTENKTPAPSYTSLIDLNSAPAYAAILQSPEQSAALLINTFLDSLVLLWSNTKNGLNDALRRMTLELIKPELCRLLRLPFFVTLITQVPAFRADFVQSLGEDGFDVGLSALQGQGWCVRFGDQ
jgi:hypothetical protein